MAKHGCCNLPPAIAFPSACPKLLGRPHRPANFIPTLDFSKLFSSSTLSLPRSGVFRRKEVWRLNRPKRPLVVSGSVVGDSETYPEAENKDSGSGATIDIKLPRRSLLVQFNCGGCGETTQRLINRLAYERGLVYVQMAFSKEAAFAGPPKM